MTPGHGEADSYLFSNVVLPIVGLRVHEIMELERLRRTRVDRRSASTAEGGSLNESPENDGVSQRQFF